MKGLDPESIGRISSCIDFAMECELLLNRARALYVYRKEGSGVPSLNTGGLASTREQNGESTVGTNCL